MIVKNVAMQAYKSAIDAKKLFGEGFFDRAGQAPQSASPFTDSLTGMLKNVNDVQVEKNTMVEAFASGKQENVHELMISLQKAGLAMSMTSAVRNKVIQAYQELMRMPF